ncbi:hypothetical protein GASC598P17_005560, partial [Gilliamella apis SCGC AB-598-P17]
MKIKNLLIASLLFSTTAPFDEVKDTIKQQLTKNISDNRFKSNVENLLTELNTTGKSDKIRLSQRYEL